MEFHFMKQKWFKWVLTFDPPTCTPLTGLINFIIIWMS